MNVTKTKQTKIRYKLGKKKAKKKKEQNKQKNCGVGYNFQPVYYIALAFSHVKSLVTIIF